MVPAYAGGRYPLTTNLAARVRAMLHDPAQWRVFPDAVRDWLALQQQRSALPGPTTCWSRSSRATAAGTSSPTASRAATPTRRSACC